MATNMTFNEVIEKIKTADMILVGLGEAFDDTSFLKVNENYQRGRTALEEKGHPWLLPAYDEWHREKLPERKAEIEDALHKLAEALGEKNYFIVSTSTNDMIDDIAWREGRLVRPCGGGRRKQCADSCGEAIVDLSEADRETLKAYFENPELQINLQTCPKCGSPMVLNNIFTEKYDESGYLSQWQLYTKWLQGTLNRKLVILELGVGMQFPSVIRWPFEKVAFFNQKAEFYRVDNNLFHMSEELKEKGVSIAKNAIDWLRGM